MKFFHILLGLLCVFFGGCPHNPPSGVFDSVETAAGVNAAELVESSEGAILAVVASMDSELQFFQITDPNPIPKLVSSIFFEPNSEGISPNPWSVAATADGKYLALTLYDAHKITLVDVTSKRVLHENSANEEAMKHPTAVATIGKQVLALYTNFQEWTFEPMVPAKYGTAKIARFTIENDTLVFKDSIALPCLNPNSITVFQNTPVISCGGSLKSDKSGNLTLDSGAAFIRLAALDPQDPSLPLTVDRTIELSGFSPTKIIANSIGFYLGAGTTQQILFIPSDATLPSETEIVSLDPEAPQTPGYFPTLVEKENIAFVSDYKSDSLLPFDLSSRTFFPDSFSKPLRLQTFETTHFFKGPQTIVARGRYLYILFSLSNEIVVVDPLEVSTQ